MNDIEKRQDIEKLVNSFYEKVLADSSISHFFIDVVPVNWEKHLPVMYDFWESIVFEKALYKGNAMQAHVHLNQKAKLEKQHFEQWLALFTKTVDELFSGPKAELAKTRALSIATVIQMKTYVPL
jgi:hemoglobin